MGNEGKNKRENTCKDRQSVTGMFAGEHVPPCASTHNKHSEKDRQQTADKRSAGLPPEQETARGLKRERERERGRGEGTMRVRAVGVVVLLSVVWVGVVVGSVQGLTIRLNAHAEECFFHQVEAERVQQGHITFGFLVLKGGQLDVDVQVVSPSDRILHSYTRATEAEQSFTPEEQGVYKVLTFHLPPLPVCVCVPCVLFSRVLCVCVCACACICLFLCVFVVLHVCVCVSKKRMHVCLL